MGKISERLVRGIKEKASVMVAVPSGIEWMADFGVSLSLMMTYASRVPPPGYKEMEMNLANTHGSILPRSRHLQVQMAKKCGSTHLLMVDSDMTFPKDTLHQLMRWKKPVVAANCVTKVIPADVTGRVKDGSKLGAKVYTDRKEGLEKVWRIGCAVMLVEMDVFDKVGPPWFEIRYSEEFDEYYGEDWTFCEKLEQEGIEIFVDHTLSRKVGHVGLLEYTHDLVGSVQREIRYKGT